MIWRIRGEDGSKVFVRNSTRQGANSGAQPVVFIEDVFTKSHGKLPLICCRHTSALELVSGLAMAIFKDQFRSYILVKGD